MYDDKVLEVFLRDQGKLFDEPVAENYEEAKEFLEEVCAVVCDSSEEVPEVLDEEMDISELSEEELLQIEEVFDIGDGRFLIVEG